MSCAPRSPASARGVEVWEPIDLARLTQEIVVGREPEAQRRGVRIDTRFETATAAGDPDLVASLVANLVENAIRHNVADGTVTISTGATADGARLTVGNTGAVIAPAEVERLFQPFRRSSERRVGTADGHGLGLTIVKAIAAAHGAEPVARPGPHGGLAIEVTLRPHT
jgi:signal transduction histidine kinase